MQDMRLVPFMQELKGHHTFSGKLPGAAHPNISACYFSSSNKLCAAAYRHHFYIWEVSSGKLVTHIQIQPEHFEFKLFSPDDTAYAFKEGEKYFLVDLPSGGKHEVTEDFFVRTITAWHQGCVHRDPHASGLIKMADMEGILFGEQPIVKIFLAVPGRPAALVPQAAVAKISKSQDIPAMSEGAEAQAFQQGLDHITLSEIPFIVAIFDPKNKNYELFDHTTSNNKWFVGAELGGLTHLVLSNTGYLLLAYQAATQKIYVFSLVFPAKVIMEWTLPSSLTAITLSSDKMKVLTACKDRLFLWYLPIEELKGIIDLGMTADVSLPAETQLL